MNNVCYAIPGRVARVEGNKISLDYFGEERTAIAIDVKPIVGEYAYAQGGVIVKIIAEKEALQVLKAWENVFFELQKRDEEAAETDEAKFTQKIRQAIHKANNSIDLSEKETIELLKTSERSAEGERYRTEFDSNESDSEMLCRAANAVRQKHQGNACCVHGIIEFSNYCRNDCAYCGIRRGNEKLKRYRMGVEEIISRADYAVNKLGFKALVLQSGEDRFYDEEKLLRIVNGIKAKCGVLLFLSIGESVSLKTYEKLFNAGAHAVLMRFETSNKKLYEELHATSFESRVRYLRELKKMGFLIATGALIGLPGQTVEDVAKDILLARELQPDMHSFGPFIPNPQTLVAKERKPSVEKVLTTLATIRLASPNAKILVTTALETLAPNAREKALKSGASSLMLDVTEEKYKRLYDLYPGKTTAHGNIEKEINRTTELLKKLGRAPTDFGT